MPRGVRGEVDGTRLGVGAGVGRGTEASTGALAATRGSRVGGPSPPELLGSTGLLPDGLWQPATASARERIRAFIRLLGRSHRSAKPLERSLRRHRLFIAPCG